MRTRRTRQPDTRRYRRPTGRVRHLAELHGVYTQSAFLAAVRSCESHCLGWCVGSRTGWMSSGNVDASAGDVVSVRLVLIPDPELDREAGERLTRQLRAELAVCAARRYTLARERLSTGLRRHDEHIQTNLAHQIPSFPSAPPGATTVIPASAAAAASRQS